MNLEKAPFSEMIKVFLIQTIYAACIYLVIFLVFFHNKKTPDEYVALIWVLGLSCIIFGLVKTFGKYYVTPYLQRKWSKSKD